MYGCRFFMKGLEKLGSRFMNLIILLLLLLFGSINNVVAANGTTSSSSVTGNTTVTTSYSPNNINACLKASGQATASPSRPNPSLSCVNGVGSLLQDIGASMIPAVGGLAAAITDISINIGFNMLDPRAEGEIMDAQAGIVRCEVPTQDIKFCYKIVGQDYQCASLTSGDTTTIYGMQFKAVTQGSLLCVQYNGVLWKTVGCKVLQDPSAVSLQYGCYTALSCGERSAQNSLSFFPITSGIVQCFDDTLNSIFFSSCCANGTGATKNNMFNNFQSSMRGIVRLLLTLYVITWGIKIALGQDAPRKGEIMMFGLKFLLVIYFSVGFTDPTLTNGGECGESNKAQDGITKYVIPGLEGLTTTLSNIMIDAGGNSTLCKFDPSEYREGYGYLALWDSLDCKFLYYLGVPAKNGVLNFATSVVSLILGMFFSLQIIQSILILLFVLFISGMMIYFVHAYLIATFGLILLIYLAPIFVPLALFEQTKGFFQGWMKLAFSFALQPVVIAAFIALMLTVFDDVIYGTCAFDKQQISSSGSGCPAYDSFSMTSDSMAQSSCNTTLGYLINSKQYDIGTKGIGGGIVNMFYANASGLSISGLLKVTVFAFLFFNFSQMIGALAADLTGGVEIRATNMTAQLLSTGAKGVGGGLKTTAGFAKNLGMKAGGAIKRAGSGGGRRGGGEGGGGGGE